MASDERTVREENVHQRENLPEHESEEDQKCSICYEIFKDQTNIDPCSHKACYTCIKTWTDQSRSSRPSYPFCRGSIVSLTREGHTEAVRQVEEGDEPDVDSDRSEDYYDLVENASYNVFILERELTRAENMANQYIPPAEFLKYVRVLEGLGVQALGLPLFKLIEIGEHLNGTEVECICDCMRGLYNLRQQALEYCYQNDRMDVTERLFADPMWREGGVRSHALPFS
jgi:hypothetical protein